MGRLFRQGEEGDLDLLSGLLLDGGDDLRERLVLLGVVRLVPPHDEIRGAHAERRHHERRGENCGFTAHSAFSPGSTAKYVLAPGARQRPHEIWGEQVSSVKGMRLGPKSA